MLFIIRIQTYWWIYLNLYECKLGYKGGKTMKNINSRTFVSRNNTLENQEIDLPIRDKDSKAVVENLRQTLCLLEIFD